MRKALVALTAGLTLLAGMLSAGPAFADETPITSKEELQAKAQPGSRSPDNASSVEAAAGISCHDVNLKSRATGKWVSVRLNNNNRLHATGASPGSWEKLRWCYDDAGNESFWSYAANRFVSNRLNNGNLMQAYSSGFNGWEEFYTYALGNGYWCVYSWASRTYASTRDNEGDVLRANRSECNGWEQYQIHFPPS
ncbi:hypothetical protein HII36_43455 [Nonomuraea sp. NN258]|uniref:fascin domain-containing protein n=1 Tax=Nonomuraea antri TaxID=2730852 RepID=UPI0015690624|nr:hypothetical protein [Nonomuraea antri]NRQ38635.1 hypothetical protein [Nonomuraea antri]